jgi:hypothetical protein
MKLSILGCQIFTSCLNDWTMSFSATKLCWEVLGSEMLGNVGNFCWECMFQSASLVRNYCPSPTFLPSKLNQQHGGPKKGSEDWKPLVVTRLLGDLILLDAPDVQLKQSLEMYIGSSPCWNLCQGGSLKRGYSYPTSTTRSFQQIQSIFRNWSPGAQGLLSATFERSYHQFSSGCSQAAHAPQRPRRSLMNIGKVQLPASPTK